MVKGLRFKKSGSEIKTAVGKRVEQLQQRLVRRDRALDAFLQDRGMVRSLLVRALGGRVRLRNPADGGALHGESDVSSEQMEEVRKVCERIFELEGELSFAQLAAYGFEP